MRHVEHVRGFHAHASCHRAGHRGSIVGDVRKEGEGAQLELIEPVPSRVSDPRELFVGGVSSASARRSATSTAFAQVEVDVHDVRLARSNLKHAAPATTDDDWRMRFLHGRRVTLGRRDAIVLASE